MNEPHKKITIGCFIVAKNEERDLPNALKSVSWCDQLVVVDMGSTDKTSEVAYSFGAEVYKHEDVGYVEPALEFAASKISCDYVLRLDADEIVNLELKSFLLDNKSIEGYEAFYLRRKNYIFGEFTKHNRYYKDNQLRFWVNGAVRHTAIIHSVPILLTEKIYCSEIGAAECIVHFNQRSVYEYIDKLNRYTEKETLKTLSTKNIYIEFFFNYLIKLFINIIRNKSYKSRKDLMIEYLSSTYYFVKYLKAIEPCRRTDIIKFYQEIADSELARINDVVNTVIVRE